MLLEAALRTPIVSVVITAADERSVVAAIECLHAQTFTAWEAVVVSADRAALRAGGTAQEALDERIRIVPAPGGRARPSRDAGVATARGEWLAFLGSGQRFLRHALDVRLAAARAHRALVVLTDGYAAHANRLRPLDALHIPGAAHRELLRGQAPPASALLVHRRALRSIGWRNDLRTAAEAWDAAIQLATVHAFAFEPTPTFVCDDEPGRACWLPDGRGYERVIRRHLGALYRTGGVRLIAKHYQAAAGIHRESGDRLAFVRCRALGEAARCLDVRTLLGAPRPSQPSAATPAIFAQQWRIDTAAVAVSLSELLNETVERVTAEFQEGQSGSVHSIEFEAGGARRRLVLKKVENERYYDFYRAVLDPLRLDSPRIYGHIRDAAGSLLLVMEHINHVPARFSDGPRLVAAAEWLAKKDTIVHEHFERLRGLGMLAFDPDRPPSARTVDECLDILRTAVERQTSPLLSAAWVQRLVERKQALYECGRVIFRGRLTLCHRDFHVRNILFPPAPGAGVYVVDWSDPTIDSVCLDLARLVGTAPESFRDALIHAYRSRITVPAFAETYRRAEVLILLAQFAWGFSTIIHRRRGPFTTAELTKLRRLQSRLTAALGLGLD